MLIYIDTNVYLDYILQRKSRLAPHDEFAFLLLQRALKCEFEIIVSDILLKELERHAQKLDIDKTIKPLRIKNKIIGIQSSYEDKKEAAMLKSSHDIPFNDILHYVLALRAGAECIVTNDRHFLALPDKDIAIKTPNSL